ncbi:DUF4286 family protein [Crocinitomicaceae bacterium]|nr:DUF4286 family protein [Crocinitomicaceae bacterium]
MILYNVTVSIDVSIQEEWLNWMKSKHIPDVMDTKCFIEARISRVHGEEEGGATYAVSYVASSQRLYDEYQQNYAAKLQSEHTQKYSGRFAAFRTILTVLEEFKHER